MPDGLITPGLVLQVAEAAEDYRITPTEFTEVMGTISSIFVAAFVFGSAGMLLRGLAEGVTSFTSEESKHHSGGNVEIERYHGVIVAVGGTNTKSPNLPDWNLSYVEYPPGQMKEYRAALMKARVNIVRVTDRRIYFEQA